MKPHTILEVFPVSEGLPEEEGSYYAGIGTNYTSVDKIRFDPNDQNTVNWWKRKVIWYLKPLPEPSGKTAEEVLNETINTYCDGAYKGHKMSGLDYTIAVKAMHEFHNQPSPKPTDEEIKDAAWKYQSLAFDKSCNQEYFDPHAHVKGYQAGAKELRDGKIKPKN